MAGIIKGAVQVVKDKVDTLDKTYDPFRKVADAIAGAGRPKPSSNLQGAINNGMTENQTPSGNVQAIPGSKLGQ